jgi:hypothetical protein
VLYIEINGGFKKRGEIMIYLKFELCVRFDKAFINVNRNRVFQTSAKDDQSFGGLFEPVD